MLRSRGSRIADRGGEEHIAEGAPFFGPGQGQNLSDSRDGSKGGEGGGRPLRSERRPSEDVMPPQKISIKGCDDLPLYG